MSGKDEYLSQLELETINGGQKLEGGMAFLVPLLTSLAMPIISKLISGGCCNHDEIKHRIKKMTASGFLQDIGEIIGKEFSNVKNDGKKTLKKFAPSAIEELSKRAAQFADSTIDKVSKKTKDVADTGIKKIAKSLINTIEASGIKSAGKKVDKRKSRGILLKKIMKTKGLSLPQASKFIKTNNLKY